MASPQDLHDMAITILAEGRGENKQGKEAIAHVINNRYQIQKAKGSSISEVVRQKLEFSGMKPNDSNRAAAQRLANKNATAYKDAIRIANDALTGKSKDPTKGATFYYADYIKAPHWAKAKTFSKVATIGEHKFYTAPKSEITAKTAKSLYKSSPIPSTSPAHAFAGVPQPRPTPPNAGDMRFSPEARPSIRTPAVPVPSPRPDDALPMIPVPLAMSYSPTPTPAPRPIANIALNTSPTPPTPVQAAAPSVPTPRANPMSQPGQLLEGNPSVPSPVRTVQGNLAAGLPTQFQDQAKYKDTIKDYARTRIGGVNPALEQDARMAVAAVYGSDYQVNAFSGSQDPFGTSYNRTGSTRHDRLTDQKFGNAVDVHITSPNGDRLTGDELAPMAQYWAANQIGSIGVPTKNSRSGVHLDYIGGKGRELGPDETQIWAYGGSVPKAVRSAFNEGLKGTLPTLKEPQNAIHVSQGYQGPLHELGYPISKNVAPTPYNRPVPSYQSQTAPKSFSTSPVSRMAPRSVPLPNRSAQLNQARAAMDTFGRVEPVMRQTGGPFDVGIPKPQMQGRQSGKTGSNDGYNTMRSYTPLPQNASFKSTTPAISYNHQPAPAPRLETRTVTQMVPTRVAVPAPKPKTGGALEQATEFAYGPTSMNVRQMNANAFGEKTPLPTPKPTYKTVMKPVTKQIQVPVPGQPKPNVSVPQIAPQEKKDDRGFLSKLFNIPSVPKPVKYGARVGGLLGGVPGMAAGAYAGYMGQQLGGALFGRTPMPNSPYQSRGVQNPNKTVGLFNRASNNSMSTVRNSGGPYSGEGWRNSTAGNGSVSGVKTFNPSTRQYEIKGVRADDQRTGDGSSSSSDGCFITTAAVDIMGEQDHGETLTTLRWFRDNVMAKHPEWAVDLVAYYHVAPIIVARTKHDKGLYRRIYKEFLRPAAKAIRAGEYERAYRLYVTMVKIMNQRVTLQT